jgi:ubiquinone/menaquinone biosynthesis C-methylase UbiE
MNAELYDTYRKVEETHWWFVVRRAIVRDLFQKYGIEKKSAILDVGCNYGYFVGDLQNTGFQNVYGADISKEAIEYGTSKEIKNLSLSDVANLPYRDNNFDIVLALDVIEHIEDDAQALREIYRVTKHEGYSLIMVPAYMFLWGLQDEVAKHYRRYTKSTFTSRVKESGFEIVRTSYFNTFLFLPIAIVRFIDRFVKKDRNSDFDLNNAFINAILKFIFMLERYVLRVFNFPFGISLLILLKKK